MDAKHHVYLLTVFVRNCLISVTVFNFAYPLTLHALLLILQTGTCTVILIVSNGCRMCIGPM